MTTPANCRVYYYANREAILAKKREQYGAMTDEQRTKMTIRVKAYRKVYDQANKVRAAERQREFIKSNPERWRASQNRWRAAHPEKDRGRYRRRRARLRLAEGHHTEQQWLARVAYYGWRCRYCRKELTVKTLTQDHVIPVFRNGSEWPSNLVPACAKCNRAKWHKPWRPQ